MPRVRATAANAGMKAANKKAGASGKAGNGVKGHAPNGHSDSHAESDETSPQLDGEARAKAGDELSRAASRLEAMISTSNFGSSRNEDKEEVKLTGVHAFIESKFFHSVVTGGIVANAIQMGVETDYPEFEEVYKATETFFTFIFSVEMFCKKWVFRWDYFKDGWNVLDFFLVWLSIIDGFILGIVFGGSGGLQGLSILRILRLMRVVKMVRLLKAFKELWLIVKGLLDSLKTIFWASLLLIMMLYVFGIFFCQMVGQNKTAGYYRAIDTDGDGTVSAEELEAGKELDYHPDFDAHQFFGNIPRAMFTLFETSLEPLNIRPIVERQPFLFPFMLIFIFLTTFGVMNVIIGVIVENTMTTSNSTDSDLEQLENIKRIEQVEKLRDAVFEIDKDGDGQITPEEVVEGMDSAKIAEYLEEVKLPTGFDEAEFFSLLDVNGEGLLSYETMLKHLLRTVVQDNQQHLLDLKITMHRVQGTAREGFSNYSACRDEILQSAGIMSKIIQTDLGQVFDEVEDNLAKAYKNLGGRDPLPPLVNGSAPFRSLLPDGHASQMHKPEGGEGRSQSNDTNAKQPMPPILARILRGSANDSPVMPDDMAPG